MTQNTTRKIDIDSLSDAELVDLNYRIVERLRVMRQIRSHTAMLAFSIGDRVTFQPDGYAPLIGTVVRYNKKTVTVIAEDGQRWNVPPGLLTKAGAEARDAAGAPALRLDRA